MVNESDRSQSEFNMAVSYLNRLNALFYECNIAAMNLDAHRWFHALMALFRELSTEMNQTKEIELWESKILDINNDVSNHIKDMQKRGVSYIKPPLYFKLHNFELFIRKILKDSGLQMRMQEDASFALK